MSDLTCYNNAVILAGDDLQPLIGHSLLVENGCILALGEEIPGARSVDLSGKLLCPMFIDAHTHVSDTGAKELGAGLPLEKVVNPPDGLKHRYLRNVQGTEAHLASMRHGLLEMLHNGTIALADFCEQGLPGVRALRQAAAGLPVELIVLGRMSETNNPQEIEAEAHAVLQEADGLGVRDVGSYPPELLKRLRSAYPHKIFAAHAAEDYSSEMRSRSPWPLVAVLKRELRPDDLLLQRGHYLQAPAFYTKRLTPVADLEWSELDFGRAEAGRTGPLPLRRGVRPQVARPRPGPLRRPLRPPARLREPGPRPLPAARPGAEPEREVLPRGQPAVRASGTPSRGRRSACGTPSPKIQAP